MVLVDAHNVLFRARATRRASGWDLLSLATALRDRRLFGREVLLVCDGDPPRGLLGAWASGKENAPGLERVQGRSEPVSFHFSGAGVEADDVIEGLLASSLRPRGMMVVSSDRRLREAAKLHGAAHMPSAALVSWLTRPGRMDERPAFAEAVPLTRLEVESWLGQLGVDAHGRPVASQRSPAAPDVSARSAGAKMKGGRNGAAEPLGRNVDRPPEIAHVDMEHWLKLFPPSESAKRGEAAGVLDATRAGRTTGPGANEKKPRR